ncbi:MAG: hypothetical protein AB7O24_03840 [Kofleriaceae bacterium]
MNPSVSGVALAIAACAPAATHPAQISSDRVASSAYRTVHIDTVAPALKPQFEAARVEWLRHLAAGRTSDQRGVFIAVGDHTFFTLRPFSQFEELDHRGAARRSALSTVDPAALKRYDDQSDAALVFPHRNEIWSYEEALSYRAANGPVDECGATAGRLVIESIRPTPPFEAQYQAAWAEIRAALQRVGYPLTRIGYASYYGDGRVFSFWLANSRDQLARAPSIEDALINAVGAATAAELLRRLSECVVATETHEITPRADLSNPELCRRR